MTELVMCLALFACAISAVEWAAARTHTQRKVAKALTLITGCLALCAGMIAIATANYSGVVWGSIGWFVVFVSYFFFRATTRQG